MRELGRTHGFGEARGTKWGRKLLKSLDSGAETALARSSLAEGDRGEGTTEADAIPDWESPPISLRKVRRTEPNGVATF